MEDKIRFLYWIDIKCSLSVKHKPIDMDEFRRTIPKRYRNTNVIDIEQMKFINNIFDILEMADK